MQRVMKKTAFTLIELLVVISIIALLMAVIMPALGKARGLARKAVCGSNLKQVAVANALYANEYKDKIVLGHAYGTDSSGNVDYSKNTLWFSLLRPYIGLNEVDENGQSDREAAGMLICPSDKTKGGIRECGAVDFDGDPAGILADSDTRFWVLRSYGVSFPIQGKKMTSFKTLSRTMFATETRWWQTGNSGTNFAWPRMKINYSNYFDIIPLDWHDGKVNVSFLDGHIEDAEVKELDFGGSLTYMWSEYYDEKNGKLR